MMDTRSGVLAQIGVAVVTREASSVITLEQSTLPPAESKKKEEEKKDFVAYFKYLHSLPA